VSGAARAVATAADLFTLDPLARFQALLAGGSVPQYLRAEPIVFDLHDPIYGYACKISGCQVQAAHPLGWCSRHHDERAAALRTGIGEAAWGTSAVGFPARGARTSPHGQLPACRFCPDRDAVDDGLCLAHRGKLGQATKRTVRNFDYQSWAAMQTALPGAGDCRVPSCVRRAERDLGLCPPHRMDWVRIGSPAAADLDRWLPRAGGDIGIGIVSLAGLAPLLAAEIRYALWAHTLDPAPARWHPSLLRTLARSCRARGIGSLLELDPGDQAWTQAGAVNRIVRAMRRDVDPVHRSREDTRERGYLDPNYWGFRFPERRSVFDLSQISQRWLRDLTWDHLAAVLDGPNPPRTAGSFETTRRAIVSFSDYLTERDPTRSSQPATFERGHRPRVHRRLHSASQQPSAGARHGQQGWLVLPGHPGQLRARAQRAAPGDARGDGQRRRGRDQPAARVHRRHPLRRVHGQTQPAPVQRRGAARGQRPRQHRHAGRP
jgi:hypothetical protein